MQVSMINPDGTVADDPCKDGHVWLRTIKTSKYDILRCKRCDRVVGIKHGHDVAPLKLGYFVMSLT